MKAVFFRKPGGLEVLEYGDFPKPEPRKGEALVRVRACALNHLDIWVRSDAKNTRQIPLPHVLGSDIAGVIEEVNGKSSFKKGDEVIVNPAVPCGVCSRCKTGEPCELVDIFGVKNQGGYAEYVTVPIAQLYSKPKNLSFIEAAAFPLDFLTAWHMLATRAGLQEGETVFVWGASGGLGSAGVQIAKHLGAKVIAAAKSREAAEKIRGIGADETVNYAKGNVESEVKRLTGGLGVDVVFESVGEKTWLATMAMLRPLGRVVIAGTTSGNFVNQDLLDVYARQLSVLGARMGTKEEFEKVLALVSAGKFRPVVDSSFPLSRARDAQEKMEERKHFGKIVLTA